MELTYRDGKETLETLAESTGGKYYDGNAANINDIYEVIAEDLKQEAGVDTVIEPRLRIQSRSMI